jgi:Zinc finger, C2H2 type
MVSILNNDDHPSFAIRSNARLGRPCSSPTFYSQQTEHQLPPVSDHQYTRPHASSESPTASPRGTRQSFAPVIESVQPHSPGSSDGSAYDYLSSQPPSSSAYHPYARQDARREPYRYPSRGPAAPRTPPEVRSSTANEAKSTPSTGTRGTGRKNKYPCPYAASHGCSATFTTSGHAARHGKKHTGEKSVHCPICNKAFTRKDNMKQHIRTHRTHSDDMRSTSEAEGETRWGVGRPDSSYASSTHSRTVSQSTDASALPPPSSGPAHPS